MRLSRLPLLLLASPLAAQAQATASPQAPAIPQAPSASDTPAQPVQLVWGDFDADGLDDAVSISPAGELTLLRNTGDGTFEDATIAAGLDALEPAGAVRFALFGDYDGDEKVDLFLGTAAGSPHLLQNQGGFFLDVTAESGITAQGPHRAAHWTDYDGDERLDLHLIAARENTLFHALEGGGFEAIALPFAPGAPLAPQTGGTPGAVIDRSGAGLDAAPAAGEGAASADRPGSGAIPRPSTSVTSTGSIDADGPTSASDPESALACALSVVDANGGGCLEASATATLGMLYPLSDKLFVEEATGNVGIGVTTPDARLAIGGVGSVDGAKLLGFEESAGVSSFWLESGFSGSGGDNFLRMNSLLDDSMTWTAGGNVGIGTTSPQKPLHLDSDEQWPFRITGDFLPGIQMWNQTLGSSWAIYHDDDDSLNFRDSTTGATRMVVRGDSGNVGIGTTTPSDNLHVNFTSGFGHGMQLSGDDPAILLENTGPGGHDYSVYVQNDKFQIRDAASNTPRLTVDTTGNVGIGSTTPDATLMVGGVGGVDGTRMLGFGEASTESAFFFESGFAPFGGDNFVSFSENGGADLMTWKANGNVGIGTTTPEVLLDVAGRGRIGGAGSAPTSGEGIEFLVTQGRGQVFAMDRDTGTPMPLSLQEPGGNVGIGTSNPTKRLDVNGEAIVDVLTIRGGADLVEGFDSSDGELEPGTVVVIDPENAGALTTSREAYDFKVAGVVSGAGGVDAGLHLGQDGVLDGDTKVAMTGRVYVKCSAENGAIQPGDRLTTASIAGHAMKATDGPRSDGAVIGKAMSSLAGGTGLVLVLVNLQ